MGVQPPGRFAVMDTLRPARAGFDARRRIRATDPIHQAGTYYFSVLGHDVAETGGNFQIEVSAVTRLLSSITPHTAGDSGLVTASLTGMPFTIGMQVELRHSGMPTIPADSVVLMDSTLLQAHFDLSGAATGVYDCVVIWPDQIEASLTGSFTITSGGIGAAPGDLTCRAAPGAPRPHLYSLGELRQHRRRGYDGATLHRQQPG